MNDRVKQAFEEGRALVDKYPDVVSAGLIAAAVERGIITQAQAETFVRTYSLSDLRGVVGALSRAIDRAGKRSELLELVKEGRRALKNAEGLLDLAQRSPR